MKRFLAMLIALSTSLLNNTEYIASDENTYFTEDYYTVSDEYQPPSYRELYNGNCVDLESTCVTNSVIVTGAKAFGNNGYYWLSDVDIADTTKTSESTYTFTGDGIIVAPFNCTVITDAQGSANGTYMVLVSTDGKYTITLENMERWFCCRNRTAPADGAWVHTDKHKSGSVTISKGYYIGKSKQGTTAILSDTESKTNISWSTIYQ